METLRDLNDLAFADNQFRLKAEFRSYWSTEHTEYLRLNRELSFAYWELVTFKNAGAAVVHLVNVKAICEERLSREYLDKYNQSLLILQIHIRDHGDFVRVAMDLQNMLNRMQSL